MSRRSLALAAILIFGIGFILTITTEAEAYYRGRGGVYRGVSIEGAFTGAVITGVYAREWR
jgi:hypothetical protein